MSSQFLGLEVGKRGLNANQTALNTVSHNLANASNKDYSRQKVEFSTVDPLYTPSLNREASKGQIGQGSNISSIKRVRDVFVDNRIRDEKSNVSFYNTQYGFLKQIEESMAEPGQPSLKEKFDDFVKSWNDVALNANDMAARYSLLSSGQEVSSMLKNQYQNLQNMRDHVNTLIESKVSELNNLSSEIKDLNSEIVKIKALKDTPNDLMDKRDALVEKLAQITNIKISEQDKTETFVYIDSQAIIQGEKSMLLEVVRDPKNNGMFKIQFKDGSTPNIKNGELAALINIRDHQLPSSMQKLNNFAINLANTVNSVHRQGFGIAHNSNINFFDLSNASDDAKGNYDTDSDGVNDSTMLYSITGSGTMKLNDVVKESGTLNLGKNKNGQNVLVDYKATDTVSDIIKKINSSSASVTAFVNQSGNIVFKALYSENLTKGISIDHLEDSGMFLTSFAGVLNASGNQGAFERSNVNQANQLKTNQFQVAFSLNAANHLNINQAIENNVANIAARSGKDTNADGVVDTPNGASDGSNAFKIISSLTSELTKNPLDPDTGLDSNAVVLDKGSSSFRSFLDSITSSLGENAKSAKMNVDKEDSIMTGLSNLRQSLSGVNMDEELVQMIKYQHGYQGSAKIIDMMNSMLDTLMHLGRA